MQAPQGQNFNETEEKVVEEPRVLTVEEGTEMFGTPDASPKSSPGSSPRRSVSDKESPINFIPEAAPRKKTSGGVNAKLESEDGQQVDAKLEEVRQEKDLDDSSPLKSTLDSPQPPSSTSPSTNPFGEPESDSDLDDDGQKEPRVEGSVGGLVNDILSNGSSGAGNSSGRKKLENFREHIYSTVRPKNDRNRQVSVGLSYSEHNPQAVNLKEEFSEVSSNSSAGTPSTGLLSLFTDNSQEPLLQGRDDSYVGGNDIKKTKRSPLRAKYAVQQANFVIPVVIAAVIAIYTIAYATSVYLQDKGSLIAFIINNPKFITVPGIIALSLFAIGIFCAVKQFRNTIEHQIQGKDADEILDKVLELHLKDSKLKNKGIESVMLLYGNGTISHFRLNTWKSHNGFINIDEKVINRTSKIESVFNDRPLFTMLLTGFIVANLALPLWLYAAGGISNITTFYQNILATNIGLSSLVATSMFALSILCLGVHYYNKTNCTNLGYHQEKLDPKEANKEIFEEIKEKRTDVIDNHRESKRVCLDFSEMRITSCNAPTHLVECCR